ncbi:MAG: threonyl-tRNA synthetase editing domain-containing protein [Anaerolineae bacterium]|nr:threonyl-tRNA synthetase editing domain-containing protein [Anaerolineae bacterium]
MKLLMFLARRFAFRPYERTLADADAAAAGAELSDAVVVFVHAEPQDEADAAGLETKFVKNVKWLAGKRGFKEVVLHSFTHLAEASASPQFAEAFLQGAADRLRRTGYRVTLTPFGWVCEWELAVYGESLAKVFKAL